MAGQGYAEVTRTAGWWTWFAVTAPTRLADAGAPLALVLLGRASTGSFGVGALMAAAYAFAEAVTAPWLGHWLAGRAHRASGHGALALTLTTRAGMFAVLATTAAALPLAALVLVSAGAGVSASGNAGALRSLLVQITEPAGTHRALSLDTVILEAAWTLAPVSVAALASLNARVPLWMLSLVTLVAAGFATRLVAPPPATAPGRSGLRLRALRPAAGSLAIGLLGGFAGGVLDTATPARLEDIGWSASLAGLLFAGYSVASVLGGLAFGRRTWPGSPHTQGELLLVTEALLLLGAAIAPVLWLMSVAIAAAGLCAAPLLTARAEAVHSDLGPEAAAAGFSALFAVNGAGYGIAGVTVGLLLHSGAQRAFALPVGAVVVLTAIASLIRRRRPAVDI
jgi:hypothetical protein